MARIKLSGLVTDIRGKLGGTVASNWKGVAYVRDFARTITNPQNAKQQARRSALVAPATSWWNLTEAQRALWEEYAKELGRSQTEESQVGRKQIVRPYPRILSGFNAYVMTQLRLHDAGLDPITSPPLGIPAPEIPEITDVSWDDTTGAFTITYNSGPSDYPDTIKLCLWVKCMQLKRMHAYITTTASGKVEGGTVTVSTIRVGGNKHMEDVPIKDTGLYGTYLFQFNGITDKGVLVPISNLASGVAAPGGA